LFAEEENAGNPRFNARGKKSQQVRSSRTTEQATPLQEMN
jgi:hypothetical protein